jgi:hypothetical protein
VKAVVLVNPALNTQEHVNAACHTLFQRLSSPRIIGEWGGGNAYDDRLFDIHRMTHDNNRRYWITKYEVEHVMENDGTVIRNSSYTGEARS